MALRFVPSAGHPSKTTPVASAPSAPGLPDLLRSSQNPSNTSSSSAVSPSPVTATSGHTLEARLLGWQRQQDSLKMESLRRTYGIAEPIRRGMELKIAQAGEWRPACLGPSANVHVDILRGTDGTIDGWEDVFSRGEESRQVPGFHAEMEVRLKMSGDGGL